jgi:hypothetical protein
MPIVVAASTRNRRTPPFRSGGTANAHSRRAVGPRTRHCPGSSVCRHWLREESFRRLTRIAAEVGCSHSPTTTGRQACGQNWYGPMTKSATTATSIPAALQMSDSPPACSMHCTSNAVAAELGAAVEVSAAAGSAVAGMGVAEVGAVVDRWTAAVALPSLARGACRNNIMCEVCERQSN